MRAGNPRSLSHARDWFVTDATAINRLREDRNKHGRAAPANSLSNQPLAGVPTLGDNRVERPPTSGTAIAHFLT